MAASKVGPASSMNAKLHKFDAAPDQSPPGSLKGSADIPAVRDREDAPAVAHCASPYALRNWLIVANVAAWLAIMFVARLLFF